MNIKDKNALITGSANRIGREIAISLSEAGVNIAIHYNKSETKAIETLNEVKKFNNLKVKKSLSANKLIGVQEINDFLKKSISIEQCKELINIKTRQYAKRQNTWARGHMKNWIKLYSKNFSILLKKTLKAVS